MGNSESSAALRGIKVEKESNQVYNDWTMARGDFDGLPVTVFSSTHPSTSRKKPYMQRALQASRVYRHPGLLRYICGGDMPNGETVVVMEEATPLQNCQQNYSALQLTAGLASIIKTLIFLHDTAGVSHNNVSLSSIFVTPDNVWKLWGLEYSCSFGDLSHRHLSQIESYCQQSSVPPDDTARIVPAYQHARDVYALASLVDDLLSTCPTFGDMIGAGDFISYLRSEAQHKEWSKRPRMVTIQSQPLLQHHFLQLHHKLNTLIVMVDNEREQLLAGLITSLRQYPETVVASSMLPLLLSRTVLLIPNVPSVILPAILTPSSDICTDAQGLFSKAIYKEYVVPYILELYSLHDLPVREILLRHLPSYVHLLPKDTLKDEILPEILLGVKDVNEELVVKSLNALAVLVSVLGASSVVGKKRLPIFTEVHPKATTSGITLPRKSKRRDSNSSKRTSKIINNVKLEKTADQSEFPQAWNEDISNDLIERSSPDGGEVDDLSVSSTPSIPDEEHPVEYPGYSKSKQHSSPDHRSKSYKHGTVGFNEIFGHSATPPPPPAAAASCDSECIKQADKDLFSDIRKDNIDDLLISTKLDGLVSKTVLKDVQSTNDEDEEDDKWSDWEDSDDQEVFHTKLVMQELNSVENFDLVSKNNQSNIDTLLKSNSYNPAVKPKTESLTRSPDRKSTIEQHTEREKYGNSTKNKGISERAGLGEEFDIQTIEVKKKYDDELDLFADLVPNLNQKKFDLEKLLEEANSKQLLKESSVANLNIINVEQKYNTSSNKESFPKTNNDAITESSDSSQLVDSSQRDTTNIDINKITAKNTPSIKSSIQSLMLNSDWDIDNNASGWDDFEDNINDDSTNDVKIVSEDSMHDGNEDKWDDESGNWGDDIDLEVNEQLKLNTTAHSTSENMPLSRISSGNKSEAANETENNSNNTDVLLAENVSNSNNNKSLTLQDDDDGLCTLAEYSEETNS